MIFGKTKLELKVGVFVFAGIVILSMFVLSIGKFKTLASGYEVKFIYNFVNGVKLGAPVRFAGVDVGEVKSIKFAIFPEEQKAKIYLNCWIKKNIKIPVDSTIWVNTLGLLGEKYIEIMPGKDYNVCLAPGESMEGIDPIPMHEVFRLSKNIADSINGSFTKIQHGEGTVGKLLYDDSIYNELESLIIDIKKNPWKLFWKTKEKK